MAVEFGQEKSGAGSFRGSGDLCFTKAAPLFVFSQPERATDRGNERQRKHVRELFQWAARASWGGRPQTDRPWSFNLSYTWPRIEQYTDALPDTQTETLNTCRCTFMMHYFFFTASIHKTAHIKITHGYTRLSQTIYISPWTETWSSVRCSYIQTQCSCFFLPPHTVVGRSFISLSRYEDWQMHDKSPVRKVCFPVYFAEIFVNGLHL